MSWRLSEVASQSKRTKAATRGKLREHLAMTARIIEKESVPTSATYYVVVEMDNGQDPL